MIAVIPSSDMIADAAEQVPSRGAFKEQESRPACWPKGVSTTRTVRAMFSLTKTSVKHDVKRASNILLAEIATQRVQRGD